LVGRGETKNHDFAGVKARRGQATEASTQPGWQPQPPSTARLKRGVSRYQNQRTRRTCSELDCLERVSSALKCQQLLSSRYTTHILSTTPGGREYSLGRIHCVALAVTTVAQRFLLREALGARYFASYFLNGRISPKKIPQQSKDSETCNPMSAANLAERSLNA
jgi:hypothetical protein